MSQGMEERDAFKILGERYDYWLRMTGFGPFRALFAEGLGGPGEAAEKGEPLERSRALAREVLGG